MFGYLHKTTPVFGLMTLLLTFATPALAEPTRELTVKTGYDNNAFGDASAQADYITQLQGSMSWWFGKGRSQTQLYYAGEGYLFAETSDRTFAVNGAGALYVRQVGTGNNRFYAGSFASVRLDRAAYQVYDNLAWKNYAIFKWYVQPSVMLRTGYSVQMRNYWHMDSDYIDHYWFLQANKFFQTQTTVRGDLSYGLKNHGYSEGQVVMGIQVAQSLAEHTGISLRYQNRLNTHANTATEVEVVQDADILYDRYDYGGHEWSARLTQQLPSRRLLVLEGGYEIRNYKTPTTLASLGLSLGTDELRRDRNPYFSAAFETPLSERIATRFAYEFEHNRSNDAYYEYVGRHSFTVDFNLSF